MTDHLTETKTGRKSRAWDGFATCPGCDARWRGNRPCHCTGCHETFSGLSMFDQHRHGGGCKPPSEAGATRLVDGIWRGPEYVPDVARGVA